MKIEVGKVHRFVFHEGVKLDIGLALFGVYLVRVMASTKDRNVAVCLFGFVVILKFPYDVEKCPDCKGKRGVFRPGTAEKPGRLELCARCKGQGRIRSEKRRP